MSYPSVEKGDGFEVFPTSVGAKALFAKASKGRRQLFVSSKSVKGSIGAALSVPYIKGKASKGKTGKGSIPLKEVGLSIPSIEKEFRIFHQKHAKSGKEAGLPSSSPSVSSVPSGQPSDAPSSSSAPSQMPSIQPSESPAPTDNSASAKARKLDGTPYPTFLPSMAPVASKTSKSLPILSMPPTENSAKARKLKGESESKSAKASSTSDDYRRGRVMY